MPGRSWSIWPGAAIAQAGEVCTKGRAWHEPDLSRSAKIPRAVGPGLSQGAPPDHLSRALSSARGERARARPTRQIR